MEAAIWFSAALLATILLATLSDRLRKLSQRLDAIDRKFALLPEYAALEKQLSKWQELALDPSSKIQAIKSYREETGAGLAEAKDAVETWMKAR
jgi:ribosomal protein L7/L12